MDTTTTTSTANQGNLVALVHESDDDVEVTLGASESGPEIKPKARKKLEEAGGAKKRRLTSGVWDHFKMLEAKPGEALKCECKKCGAKYNAESKYGTGNLNRHLQKCMKMSTTNIGQYLIASSDGLLATRNPQFSQEKFREMLVHAIVRHDLPFKFVEYEGFRDLFKYLEPRVAHFGRQTARSDVRKMHVSQVSRLRNELVACPSRICLTSDAWTSIVTDGYLSLTAHYIDSSWVLQKKILNFTALPPPHTGKALAEKIYSLATEWGIEKKLFSITLDNASANDSCVTNLITQLRLTKSLICDGVLFHVRCCAHILNLIVQDGLKEIDLSVDKIRDCVKYIKGSQGRKIKFKQSAEKSSLNCKKALVQDVPTRWNATYRMLSSALYYKLAFSQLAFDDEKFKCNPSEEEWTKIEKICNFLEVFYVATNVFSGSRYPTSNLYFPQVFLIQRKLVKEISSPDSFMRRIAEQMFVKFNKYWSEFILLLAVAVVFDPRYKFGFLEFSYNKLYGVDSVELERVKNTLFGLYDEYLTLAKTSKPTTSCSRGSNDAFAVGVGGESHQDPFKEFDQFTGFEYGLGAQKSQLEMYLDEPRAVRTSKIEVLDFWKSQSYRYPDLARLAMDILCVPISTVASESAFSVGGRILDQYRSTLSPNIVESLICSRDWLFGSTGIATSIDDLVQDIMSLNIGESEVECEEGSNVVHV